MKPITYTCTAIKTLRKMPAKTSGLIVAKIEQYAADSASLANNVTELKGRTGIWLRVVKWRVIMDDGEVLAILAIGPRGSVYE